MEQEEKEKVAKPKKWEISVTRGDAAMQAIVQLALLNGENDIAVIQARSSYAQAWMAVADYLAKKSSTDPWNRSDSLTFVFAEGVSPEGMIIQVES